MVKEIRNQLLLFDKFQVGQSLGRFLYSLVQPILKSIGNIDDIDNFSLQTRIEHVSFVEIVFEVSATCQHDTCHIASVISYEGLHCNLTDFTQIVMSLFLSQTSKTDWRLTSLMMFLRQLDCKFSDNLTSITLKGSIECTITIYDDEPKWWFSNQQLLFEFVQIKFRIAVVDW